jgi:two-component system, NarL family, response regulator LiaR
VAIIRLLLVDDHQMFRQGLRALIEIEPDIEVVGECANGREAVTAVQTLHPDVILLDLNMPVLDGVAATREILALAPATGVIILSMNQEDANVFQAVKNGARGYILKDAGKIEVLRAVRTVAAGEAILAPALALRVMAEFQRLWAQPQARPAASLTTSEMAILRLVATGRSNKEIGAVLNFSEKTIRNYVSRIFQKLQVSDRTQAAVYAVQHGLGETSAADEGLLM